MRRPERKTGSRTGLQRSGESGGDSKKERQLGRRLAPDDRAERVQDLLVTELEERTPSAVGEGCLAGASSAAPRLHVERRHLPCGAVPGAALSLIASHLAQLGTVCKLAELVCELGGRARVYRLGAKGEATDGRDFAPCLGPSASM